MLIIAPQTMMHGAMFLGLTEIKGPRSARIRVANVA
jgi:hypothetical protein